LILEATCAPADITYPTDLGLLNEARVHTEKIIDILYKYLKYQAKKKPRTYRHLARKDYLAIAKQRRPTRNKKRQAIKKQLQYIKRNLAHIEQLVESGATLGSLNKKQYKTLLVLTEVYRQQLWLFKNPHSAPSTVTRAFPCSFAIETPPLVRTIKYLYLIVLA